MGLQWVSAVVLPDPDSVARSSFLLSSWFIEARASATDQGLLPAWQRVVDALVVAGMTRLAPAPARLAKADLLGSTIVVGLSSGFDRLAALVVLGTIRRV